MSTGIVEAVDRLVVCGALVKVGAEGDAASKRTSLRMADVDAVPVPIGAELLLVATFSPT